MRTRPKRRTGVRFGLLLALICAAVSPVPAGTAGAAEACVTASGSTTCTFDYTGAAQTWTVPDGVTQVTLDVFGAQGGTNPGPGGQGGRATTTFTVSPGDTLTLVVGGQGQSHYSGGSASGGFNGGGNGGAPFNLVAAYSGSGGGGASDVRIGGTGLVHRVIVAGGGGGTANVGNTAGGGGGGLSGGAGTSVDSVHAVSGGAGGNQDGTTGSGQLGTGSNGVNSTSIVLNGVGAGGGGGGYYGGAGGPPGTGGGGGSGFGPTGTVFQTGVRTGNGQILLTYTPDDSTPPTTTISLSPAAPDGSNGWYVQHPTLTVAAVDNNDGSGVAETRCVLNPASVPSSFDDLPSTPCPYLGGGAIIADGLHTVYTASIDAAGNTEDPLQSMSFKVDTSSSTDIAFVGSIADGSTHTFGAVPTAPTCTATDTTSGLSGCVVTGYSSDVGSHTVTATATDNAGNQATSQISYTVQLPPWTIKGFTWPVAMHGEVNSVKRGWIVPLIFEVFAGTTEVTDPAQVSMSVQQINCASRVVIPNRNAAANGWVRLHYERWSGKFIAVWMTPKKPGTCYAVTATTSDGPSVTAYFKLK